MRLTEFVKRSNNLRGAKVMNLWHLLLSSEEELDDMRELMYGKDRAIPKNYKGFVARVSIPDYNHFQFKKDGEVGSWSASYMIQTIVWIYGKNGEELLIAAEKAMHEKFNSQLEQWKESQLINQ